jgi:WD40 repeat protein/serine/threonine protein kinase
MNTLNVVESIFFAALEKDTAEARAAYLAEACNGDANLRHCVERLLNAHAKADDIIPAQSPGLPVTVEPAPIAESPGSVIGPYKLLQQLGEGGFGVVFMAEQEQPVRRKVALKIIKPGMDSKQVVARFEAERQALAIMDHPNIARVLDGGTTESGRPYFVMELVKGVPITEFCDQNRLTPRERLELFIPVCRAMQHAHQKGIIHRDLKPSNVLVTMYDDKPVPKVIDFGVAKAIEQKLTEQTLFTRVGQIVGTLEYMSPEQATLNALDVDTRADIYALGVLLYELLTGTTPLNKSRLEGMAFLEMLRLIREEEPPRPSARLSQSGDALTAYAVDRRTETLKLPALVQGELDWIAMRALEKDRARRYDTANALAADVQRYLNDERVEACPPTLGYRVQKYVRRHKAFISMMGTVAALLLVGIATTSRQAFRATRAENDAITALGNAEEAGKNEAKQRAIAVAAADEAQRLAKQEKSSRHLAESARHAIQLDQAFRAWEQHNVADAERVLDEVDVRFEHTWEQRYLRELCRRKVRTLAGHADAATCVAISADGKLIATGSADKTVIVWDEPTGQVKHKLAGHKGKVNSVAMTPDGRRIVSASDDGTVKVWDAAAGTLRLELVGHTDKVLAVAISADGERVVSGGTDKTVKLWDVDKEKALTLEGHDSEVIIVAIDADGRRIASAERGKSSGGFTGNSVKLWNMAQGQEKPTSIAIKGDVTSLAMSPDGGRVAVGNLYFLWSGADIFDARTGRKTLTLSTGVTSFTSLAFSADGQSIVSASRPFGVVKLWDTATGREQLTLRGYPEEKFDQRNVQVAASANGQRIVSVNAEGAKVWNVAADPEKFNLKLAKAKNALPAFVSDLAIHGQRIVAVGGRQDDFHVWDAATGNVTLTLKGPSRMMNGVAFSADGIRILSDERETMKVWNASTGEEILAFKAPFSGGRMAFTSDGASVVLAGNGAVKVLDAATGHEHATLKLDTAADNKSPNSPAISADARRVVFGNLEGTMTVVDVITGQAKTLVKGSGRIFRVAFSPDGTQILSGNSDGTVKLWDAATGDELLTLNGHRGGITCLAMSADGLRIVSGARDGTLRVWDTATGQGKLVLKSRGDKGFLEGGSINHVALSHDGSLIVAGGDDGIVRVWEAPLPQAESNQLK